MAEEYITLINGDAQEKLFQQRIADRTLVLDYVMDESCFTNIGEIILRCNREDKGLPVENRKPIKLYLMCDGGSVVDGINLINIIRASKTPVYTIVTGQAFSMAFYLAVVGHKRYAFKDAMFLVHDGIIGFEQTQRKAKDLMDFNDKIDQRLDDLVVEFTGITKDELNDKNRTEWYMFADEAKEKGIIDFIIGEDCELEEVC